LLGLEASRVAKCTALSAFSKSAMAAEAPLAGVRVSVHVAAFHEAVMEPKSDAEVSELNLFWSTYSRSFWGSHLYTSGLVLVSSTRSIFTSTLVSSESSMSVMEAAEKRRREASVFMLIVAMVRVVDTKGAPLAPVTLMTRVAAAYTFSLKLLATVVPFAERLCSTCTVTVRAPEDTSWAVLVYVSPLSLEVSSAAVAAVT